jgi:hypothetical protein
MSRRVWPHAFLASYCELTEAVASKQDKEAAKIPFPTTHPDRFGVPIAVRWSTAPLLGFPRQPFSVYRRRAQALASVTIQTDPVSSTGLKFLDWTIGDMIEVRFAAQPASGQALIVDALDRRREPIPGQRFRVTSNTLCRFRAPGIAALRLSGVGQVHSVVGVNQLALANATDWALVQVVGFPFDKSVALPVYNPLPQGYAPAALNGPAAAKQRLEIARVLHLQPPPTGAAALPTPDWPAPDSNEYLQFLREPLTGPLALVRECLENSSDTNPTKLQVLCVHERKIKGLRQTDLADSPTGDPAQARLPIAGVIGLSTSGESYAATGLGYGTVDFPPPGQKSPSDFKDPPGTVVLPFDYMVATEFVFPGLGAIELAAIAEPRPLPLRPTNLTATTEHTNRPAARDLPVTESVRVEWDLSSVPHGYAITFSPKSGETQVLNAPRTKGGGFEPFLPLRPPPVDGSVSADAQTRFVHSVAPVPLSGATTTQYLVAGLDVFGRWSAWRLAPHTVAALPVAQPGLHSASLTVDTPAGGRAVKCSLVVEFSWDWSDRSPDRIEFVGKFFAPGGDPGAAPTTFPVSASNPVGSRLIVRFSATDDPFIDPLPGGSTFPNYSATIESLTTNPPDPDRRRYRLTVKGRNTASAVLEPVLCDFSAAGEIAFAVYALGFEKIRPTVPSAATGPVVARLKDPLPATVPPLPTEIIWTALPDATGRARAVFSWPTATNAAGYAVWQATETGIRVAIDPSVPEFPPEMTPLARAEALRNMIDASTESRAKSLAAFTRLNTRLISGTNFEVDLPGEASTLYAYRISSVTAANVESERSASVAVVAVPRRNQPGQPRLQLRSVREETGAGILVTAVAAPGPLPAGYRVFRVRNVGLLNSVGLMGPPVILPEDSGWHDVTAQLFRGEDPLPARAILDPVAESWFPYFYRVVALGAHNPAGGEYRGESLASASQEAFFTPAAPPVLTFLNQKGIASNRVVRFETNLPLKRSPLGPATLTVVALDLDAATKKMTRRVVLSVPVDQVAEGPPLALLLNPSQADLAKMPEIVRSAPNAAGLATFSVRMRNDFGEGAVVATDPLDRSTEITIPGNPT